MLNMIVYKVEMKFLFFSQVRKKEGLEYFCDNFHQLKYGLKTAEMCVLRKLYVMTLSQQYERGLFHFSCAGLNKRKVA